MKAVVVYESLWSNTASIAQAIAEGIGDGAEALRTDRASAETLAGVDLLIAGAPLLGFTLPTARMRQGIAANPGKPPTPPDLSHPLLRDWLGSVPPADGARFAAFETRFRISPGSATKEICRALEAAGYRQAAESERFIVKGKFGPLKEGEIERARRWGELLAAALPDR